MKHGITEIDKVTRAVLDSQGESAQKLRAAVETRAAHLGGLVKNEEIPQELELWVEKVSKHAFKTTDSDVDELKRSGYTENQIFELTIAAAHGAARARLELALAAVSKTEGGPDEA